LLSVRANAGNGSAPRAPHEPNCAEPLDPPSRTEAYAAIIALRLGYGCALIWVIAANVVFDNRVPLEHFEFHGLYPLSLALNYASVTFVIPFEADVDEHSRYFRLDTGALFLAFYALSALLIASRIGWRRG
jgi:hypothetical protein